MTGTNNSQFRFKNWQVYIDAQKLNKLIYELTKTFPREMRYEATSQLLRSSLSIVLNIAEGSGKNSAKELARFLDIAMGSLYETLACLDSLYLVGVIKEKQYQNFETEIESLARQIGGFRKSLKL